MKKMLLFFLIFTIVSLFTSCSQKKEDNDFRETKWGMKINEVIAIEAVNGNKEYKRRSKGNEELIYENVDFNGQNVNIRYLFATEAEIQDNEDKTVNQAKFEEPILLIAKIEYSNDTNQQLKDDIFKELESMYGKYDSQTKINEIVEAYGWHENRSTIYLVYVTPPVISMQANKDTILKIYKGHNEK